MTKELVISANRHETKLAVLEDDQLVEVFFQRSNEYSLVGSIHKGRVTRVLPGMQSAFVELGLERDAFLYVSDFMEQTGEDYERVSTGDKGERREQPAPRENREARESRPPQSAPAEVTQAAPAEVRPPAKAAEGGPRDARDGRDRGGDRGGDRRGRRGRRRRGGRNGGFPESKYAAPGDAQAPSAVAPGVEPDDGREQLERIVLPGESIAKYSQASGEEPDGERETAAEETVEAGAAGLPSREAAAEAPAVEAEVDSELQAEVHELLNEAVAEEEEIERQAEAAQEAAEAAVAEEHAGHAGSGAAALAPDAPVELDEAESEEEEAALDAEQGDVDEGDVEEGDAAEGDAAEETTAAPAAREAGVRDQPVARYIQRGPRRVRRRGGRSGGGERYESVPRQDTQTVSAPEGTPAVERTERPERAERNDRGDRGDRRDRDRGRDRDRERPPLPSISDLLKEGQEIIVQIAKEPLGTKGARITSHIAMPGRYVVYMPTLDHLGVSRKVASDEERQRLKRIVQIVSQGMTGGFIVRTAGEGKPEADLAADMSFLYNQWLDIRKKAERRNAPCLLHSDLELVTRTLRDQVSEQFKAIWVDNEEVYEAILGFLERFQPALVNRVKLYTRDTPVFDTFNITAELEKALRPKVWLKSGGYIVINQTEALVAIDINTGKFVGKSNSLEDTIVKTNLEAVKEIVRQVRLRDLGGIIVLDFIDMDQRKNRQKVMQALEEAMRVDRAPYKILQFNDFGLVAITRRRVKQSLERALCQPCPICEGAGYVKSVQTVVGEILTEAHKIAKAVEGNDVMLRVNPDVAKVIKNANENYIAELEEILGRTVIVKSDPLLHPEKFDLA